MTFSAPLIPALALGPACAGAWDGLAEDFVFAADCEPPFEPDLLDAPFEELDATGGLLLSGRRDR
jgi:hypothetical protein